MLVQLSGTITSVNETSITLDVHGIGFDLQVTEPATYAAKTKATMFTYLHWHQEQGPSLYGFNSLLEKQVFMLIITCSGIGPKIGLAALRHFDALDFLQTITMRNSSALSKVNGIGAKKAEHMILQLQDKASKLLQHTPTSSSNNSKSTMHIKEVGDALSSLGYSRQEVTQALQSLHDHADDHEYVFDRMFRKALSFLTRN